MSQHYQSHGTNKSYWEFYVLLVEQIRSLVACGRTVGLGPDPDRRLATVVVHL